MLKIDVKKSFLQNGNIFKLEFKLETDEDIFLAGNSGSGKTTLLNIIAGIIEPDMGEISFDSNLWYSSSNKKNIKIQKRDIAYLFQDYRLFDNMNVEKNIYYGMNEKDSNLLKKLLKMVDMEKYSKFNVSKLSGGQKQRVALARAIARKPRILLLDEPFSALDFNLKKNLIYSIKSLQKEFGFKLLMVSHDLREILKFKGKLIYLENGRIKKEEEICGENKKHGCFLEKWFLELGD